MAVNIATAYLAIVPSMQGLQGNLQNAFRPAEQAAGDAGERAGSSFGSAFKGVLGAAAALGVATSIKDFAETGVKSLARIEQINTQTETVIKSTGGAAQVSAEHVEELAGQMENLTASEAETVQKGANFLLTFKDIKNGVGEGNDIFDQTVKIMNDMSVATGQDMQSAALQLGKALNDPTKGLTALTRVGVTFTDEQKKQIETMQAAGDTMGAQKVILQELNSEFGGAGLAYGQTIEGQMKLLGHAFGTFQESVMARAMPAVSAFSTAGAKLFNDAATWVDNFTLPEAMQGAFNTAKSYAQDFTAAMKTIFTGDFDPSQWFNAPMEDSGLVDFLLTVRENAVGAFSTIKSYAQDAGAAVMTVVTGDFDPSKWFNAPAEDSGLVGFLLTIRETAVKVGESIGPLFSQITGELGGALSPVFSEIANTLGPAIVDVFGKLWEAVSPLVPTILDLVSAFNPFSLIFKALEPVLPKIVDLVAQLVQSLGGVLAKVIEKVGPLLEKLVGAFMDFVPVLVDALMPILPVIVDVLTDLAGVLGDALSDALDAVAPLIETVVDVIADLMPFVGELVKKLLPPLAKLFESIAPLLSAVLDALMPLVAEIADALIPVIESLMPIVERVFTFIADTINNLVAVFQGVIDFVTGVFSGDWDKAWSGIKEIFGGIWDQIKNIFSTLWDVIVEFFTNLGPRLWDIVVGLAGQLVQWGGQFLGWIWQGIQDLWTNTIWPWFVGLPGLVWSGIQAAAGQMVTWGGEFLSWLWSGITGFWDGTAWPWITNLPQAIWDGITSFAGGVGAWLGARGSEFLDWVWNGIKTKFEEVKQWFANLPSMIWDAIKSLWTNLGAWGAEMIKSISEGIEKGGPYLGKALWDVVKSVGAVFMPGIQLAEDTFNVSGTIDTVIAEYERQQTLAGTGGSRPFGNEYRGGGRATGGIIPGADPGRGIDNVLVPMRSGESVFVPEFTRAIGGEATVHAWNRAAEQGRLGEIFGRGFAAGGVIGSFGHLYGLSFMRDKLIPYMTDQLKQGFEQKIAGQAIAAANGQWGPATDGSRLADNTQAARDFIVRRWGITNIGGVYGGSVPGSDHPIGKALDVMIANYLSQAGIAQGTSVADWFVANPNAFGTKYVIWRDRINQGGAWSPYQHPSGSNDTLQHRDHVHLSFLTGTGQFQGGASVPSDDKPTGLLGQLVSAFTEKFTAAVSGVTPDGVAGGAYPPLVERWRPLVTDVLTQVGQYKGLNLLPFVDRGLLQINSESSGNPDAINLYDINAQRGDPSIGLLQVIRSTFVNALRGTPFEGLIALGQRDPRASVTASTLYSLGRYGSLDRAWRGVAYRYGGMVPALFGRGIDSVPAMLTPDESVLTAPQTEAYQTVGAALEAGFWGGELPPINVYIDGFSDLVDVRVEYAQQDLVNRARQMQVQGR